MPSHLNLPHQQTEFLKSKAFYIWWKSPDQALEYPDRLIAQLMTIGDIDTIIGLRNNFESEQLRHVINNAEIGWFNKKSWHFWNLILEICPVNKVPPLPERRLS